MIRSGEMIIFMFIICWFYNVVLFNYIISLNRVVQFQRPLP